MANWFLQRCGAADPSQCDSKKSGCFPQIIPSDSSHLLISWKDLFEVCNISYIERGEIKLKRRKLFVAFDQLNVKLKADPCLEHRASVGLFIEGKHKTGILLSYNSESFPFGGLFDNSVVQKMCIKPNGQVSIPTTPESLENCGIMIKDVWNTNFNRTMTNVRVSFNSPEDPTSTSHSFQSEEHAEV